MLQVGGYVFKRAETDDEFDQIHALNYRTFVGEIPQHADTGTGRLVDKFHHKNTYFIALADREVVGMVSVHGQAPFSIADRLPDPGLLERPGTRPLEVRLLAIKSEKRHSVVYSGLIWTLFRHAQEVGATHLFISGVQERLSLYEQLGFEQIGPPVQGGRAIFIPMAVPINNIAEKKHRAMQLWIKRLAKRGTDGEAASQESGARSQEADEEHDLAGPRRGPAPASAPRGQKVVCLLP